MIIAFQKLNEAARTYKVNIRVGAHCGYKQFGRSYENSWYVLSSREMRRWRTLSPYFALDAGILEAFMELMKG